MEINMKYKSILLSEVKRNNKRSFANAMIFCLVFCIFVTITIWQLPKYLVAIIIVCSELLFVGLFAFIYLTGFTYRSLRSESNNFDEKTLEFIDSDFKNAKRFGKRACECTVGNLYFYSYYKDRFIIVPIFEIDLIDIQLWMFGRTHGDMQVITMKTGQRIVIGPFGNREFALHVAQYIVQQNSDIKLSKWWND